VFDVNHERGKNMTSNQIPDARPLCNAVNFSVLSKPNADCVTRIAESRLPKAILRSPKGKKKGKKKQERENPPSKSVPPMDHTH
jgi:hypothetical protein